MLNEEIEGVISMLNEEIEKVISGFTSEELKQHFMLLYRENEFLRRSVKSALEVQDGLEKEINDLNKSISLLSKEVERYRMERFRR